MILTERGNYLVAVLTSVIFHLLLLLIYIPQYFTVVPVNLQTYPVGLVEVASGSSSLFDLPNEFSGPFAAAVTPAQNPSAQSDIQKEQTAKEKTVFTPTKVTIKPKEDLIILPKKDSITNEKSKTPDGSLTNKPGVISGQNNEAAELEKLIGFGTGEGMVTVLGPLPPYPKNAMNEGKEGNVAIKILVKADGSLEGVNLLKSSGDLRLDKVAVSAIERNWKFKPVTKNYYIDVVFSFSIRSGVAIKFLNSGSRP